MSVFGRPREQPSRRPLDIGASHGRRDPAIRTTRSIRRFTAEPVAEDDLRAILDAGRRAQSSMNGQPWRFVVVSERATLEALAGCGRYAGATTLAWAPEPTTVTAEQRAAAEKACTENLVIGSGAIEGLEGREGAMPSLPPAPTALPPLTSLELHGSGGVAILADESMVGYCLLRWDGTTFTAGGLALGPAEAPAGSFAVSGMSTEFEGQALGIVGGAAPSGAATVTVVGGPADGGTATVQEGRFAIWIPGTMGQDDVELVARDAEGREVGRQTLSRAGEEPVIVTLTPDPNDPDGVVEGLLTPAP